jgi:hypothetical protein
MTKRLAIVNYDLNDRDDIIRAFQEGVEVQTMSLSGLQHNSGFAELFALVSRNKTFHSIAIVAHGDTRNIWLPIMMTEKYTNLLSSLLVPEGTVDIFACDLLGTDFILNTLSRRLGNQRKVYISTDKTGNMNNNHNWEMEGYFQDGTFHTESRPNMRDVETLYMNADNLRGNFSYGPRGCTLL